MNESNTESNTINKQLDELHTAVGALMLGNTNRTLEIIKKHIKTLERRLQCFEKDSE